MCNIYWKIKFLSKDYRLGRCIVLNLYLDATFNVFFSNACQCPFLASALLTGTAWMLNVILKFMKAVKRAPISLLLVCTKFSITFMLRFILTDEKVVGQWRKKVLNENNELYWFKREHLNFCGIFKEYLSLNYLKISNKGRRKLRKIAYAFWV